MLVNHSVVFFHRSWEKTRKEKKTMKIYNVLKRSKMGFSDFPIFRSPGPGGGGWGVPRPSGKCRVFLLTAKNVGFFRKSLKAKFFRICISVLKDFLLEVTFLKLQNTNIFNWQSVFLLQCICQAQIVNKLGDHVLFVRFGQLGLTQDHVGFFLLGLVN